MLIYIPGRVIFFYNKCEVEIYFRKFCPFHVLPILLLLLFFYSFLTYFSLTCSYFAKFYMSFDLFLELSTVLVFFNKYVLFYPTYNNDILFYHFCIIFLFSILYNFKSLFIIFLFIVFIFRIIPPISIPTYNLLILFLFPNVRPFLSVLLFENYNFFYHNAMSQ